MDYVPSMAFSLLKCAYGWNGCGSLDVMNKLDEIANAATCPDCAAAQMAAVVHAAGGKFRQRIDGKPNACSVECDQQGGHGSKLN